MTEDLPIYEHIKRELRELVRTGVLKEGDPVPSENELSERYGASRHQTRQALRELELEGYLFRSQGRRSVVAPARHRMGAFPLDGAKTVAIVLQTQGTQYERGIYNGVQSILTAHAFQSIAYNLMFDEQSELEFLRHVQGLGVAGMILWIQHPRGEGRELLGSFRDAGFPVVLVDRDVPGLALDNVTTDNRGAGRELTRQLIARGHQEIGFFTDPHHANSGEERFLGYREALAEAGLPFREEFFDTLHLGLPEAGEIVKRMMSHRVRPTAFTCIHELFVRELVESLRALDFEVPRDVELAAITDEGFARDLGVPMIGARQPAFEMGRRAAELLFARIADPQGVPAACRLPVEFLADADEDLCCAAMRSDEER